MMIKISKVIGHRGAAAYAPENTFASFYKAKQCGAEWVEFDVMQAHCGDIIVFHDETLQRTTNGRGRVSAMDYPQIALLDAGSWFSSEFTGEKVPRFKDTINYLAELGLQANIEIKAAPGTEKTCVLAVWSLIRRYWPQHLQLPLISSFNYECLTTMRECHATIPLGLLLSFWKRDWLQLASGINCISVHCNYRALTPKRIQAIKQNGYLLLSYTVNDKTRALQLLGAGVDAIFSDYPDLLLQDS